MTIGDRSTPWIRIERFASERSRTPEAIDLVGRVLSFRYDDHDERADACTLELDNRDLALFDREDLAGGTIFGVSWGYRAAMAPRRRVVVRRMRGFARLTLECHGLATLFDRVPRTRRFEGATASEIVQSVARELGYDDAFVDVEETSEQLDVVSQTAETDARFLARLGARHGFVFRADDGGLSWRRARTNAAPSHVFTYYETSRGDILDVSVETDLGRRAGGVTVRGRDPLTRTTIEAHASSDTVLRTTLADVVEVVDPETGRSALEERTATSSVRTTTAPTTDAAQNEADARFRVAEQRAVRLKLTVVGDPTLAAGSVIEVRQISRLLSGRYYVRSATHSVSGDGYTTELSLRRDGVGRLARSAARAQGGSPNTAPGPSTSDTVDGAPDVTTQVEAIDPETGRGAVRYRASASTTGVA